MNSWHVNYSCSLGQGKIQAGVATNNLIQLLSKILIPSTQLHEKMVEVLMI